MKITLYKLLGLVKDNKQPEKVKYKNEIYEFDKGVCDYFCNKTTAKYWLFESYTSHLDEIVEIIPKESNEWKDIKEVDFLDGFNDSYYDTCLMKMGKICNQLIKNQKYLKERLEAKDE